MAKQLNVNLAFTADTKQAQQQIAQLQKSLDGLLSKSIENSAFTGFNKDISNAQQSVLKLKTVINSSLNADTGRLDLSKFNMQLNNSGLSIGKLASDMSAMGSDGQKAFLNLANSIVTAQKPMLETNKLLDGMWTALKNTARWQLSSSILHGFVGSLQGAYGYAQDLNQSLNNIRIVTGQSTDQMAAFADQANKSAQALSASTLAYTDAALIYYQQGLGDAEVQARTETTLKMSNVTRDSVEEVSSYMTAIWNNFADGADNLELFADKITALGAATASSSAEIAQGLNQFASLGSSLGLEYDDAVAALATVVAQTRQSASTVGNSFRTLFQRIESLKLGDTLEDGVGLTKYSEALEKVGVQVLDVNGEMRDMHDVIQDLGAVWQNLSKAQQNALAQTVGGVRNSNTLIAWMDNFEKFQENLNVSYNAEGALEEQAEIYAESWEAARKRVQAAWQALYQDFIDEKFFIGIANGAEKVLQILDKFVDSIGGLPGVLGLVATGITMAFGPQLTKSLENAQLQLSKILKPTGSKNTYAEINDDIVAEKTIQAAIDQRMNTSMGAGGDLVLENLYKQLELNKKLRDLELEHNSAEYQRYRQLIDINEEYSKEIEKLVEINNKNGKQARLATQSLLGMSDDERLKNTINYKSENGQSLEKAIGTLAADSEGLDLGVAIESLSKRYFSFAGDIGVSEKAIEKWIEAQINAKKTALELNNVIDAQSGNLNKLAEESNGKLFVEDLKDLGKLKESAEKAEEKVIELKKEIDRLNNQKAQQSANRDNIINNKIGLEQGELNKKINEKRFAIKQKQASLDKWENFKDTDSAEYKKKFKTNDNGQAMVEYVNKLKKEIENLNLEIEQLQSLSYDEIEKDATEAVDNTTEELNKKTEELKIAEEELKTASKAVKEAENNINQPSTNLSTPPTLGILSPEFKKSFSESLQGFTQLTTGIFSLSKALDVLDSSDPDLSFFDKLQQALPSLAMALPMISSGLGKIPAIMEVIGISAKDLTTAIQGGFTSMISLITSGVGALMTTLGPLLAVVAAVWAFKKLWDMWQSNTPEGKLEAINKKLEEQTEKVQEATDAYDALTDAYDKYNSAKEQLNDKDSNLSEQERLKLIQDTNSEIYEVLRKSENWKDIIGNLKYDENGLLVIQDEQWKAIQNDLYRNQVLETQKQRLLEIAQIQAGANVEESDYNGPKFKTSGFGWSDEWGGEAYIEEDRTSDVVNDLANAGISNIKDLKQIKDINASKIAEIFTSFSHQERADILEWAQELSDEEVKTFNEYLEKINSEKQEAELMMEQTAREALAGDENFNNYDETSQNTLIEKFSELDDDSKEVFTDTLWETRDLEAALNSVGIKLDDLNLKFRDLDDTLGSHHMALNINADDLTHFKGKTEDLEQEVNNFADYLEKNIDTIDELDSSLKNCKEGVQEVAYAIIRFDDAIQDVTDNYDDWMKALKSGAWQDVQKAAKELQKTYGNLLDIDGSKLSEDFLEDEKNLELMKEAINGNIVSYNELVNLAGADYLKVTLGIDDNAANQIISQYNSLIDSIYPNFEDLPVHASLDDVDFISGLENMLNATAMTANQAQEFLANMGVDAEVVEDTTKTRDTKQLVGAIPEETEPIQIGATMTEASGIFSNLNVDGVATYSVKGYRMKPDVQTETEDKENTAFALKVKTAKKSAGGSVKYKNSSHGGGSGNTGKKGGSCFASGTLITTDHNYKNIEDIKVGDTVLSYNEKTKKNEYSKVLQTMIHNVYEKIYDLFVKDDKLKVTGNHRFLVVHNNEQKWIEAADLQVGDLVLFADGTLHQISKIKTQTRFITVYNFEVSNTHNYYVGENQILAHNKGGSGKGSQRKAKEPVKYERKEDRYHDLKEQLEDVRLQYDKVNKAKERAFGKSKLKYLDLEIKELQKEDKLLKDYVKEAEKYYQIDRSKVEDLNIGAKFDENGALINYEEVLSRIEDDMVKATDEYNKAIAAWNADGSDEDFEKAEKAKKNAEELQKTRMDALKQLEDTYNTWQDKVWEEIQKRWEIYDAKLEKVTLNVEIELEFNEADLELLQFIFDHMGESADTAVDKIANLNEQMKEYDDNIKHIRSGLQGIFNNHAEDIEKNAKEAYEKSKKTKEDTEKYNKALAKSKVLKDIDFNNMNPDQIAQALVTAMDDDTFASELTEEEAKTIRGYITDLMDNTKKLEESFDQVFETVKEGYDQWNERLQDQMGEYARLNKIVSSYKDLVSLIGKDAFGLSYDELNKWNQELIHVAQNQAESAEKIWKDNEALYQNAVAMYNTAETEEEKKKWKEIMDQRKKTTDEAHQDYLDKVNEWQEAVQTAFEEALDYAKDKYEKSFGQFNFNFIEDEYERLNDLDKLYLKPYEKYHDLQKSLKELGKSITDTTNPTVLNKMLTLQDEINDKMASGVQMSSYETGIIERRVALLQAEADLQNAKNAKGAVRMTRDNEGNFSYTYTADQDAIDSAQENLSEKFYELLKFERDSLDEIQSRILEETRTYQETLDDLARTYGKDSEEYQRYAKIVTDDHIEKMRYLESQSDMLYGEMARLRDDDWHDLERIFGYKLASTDSFLTQESDTLLGRLFGEGGIFPTIRSSEQQYLQDIQDDVTQYGANTQAVVDNVTTNMKQDIESIGTTADETKKKVHDLGEQMKTTMTDADTAAKGIAKTWADHMKTVRDDTTTTASKLNELLEKLKSITTAQKSIADGYTKIKDSANAAAAAMNNAANSGGGSGSGSGGGSGTTGGGGSPSSPQKTPQITKTKSFYTPNSNGGSPRFDSQSAAKTSAEASGLSAYYKYGLYSDGHVEREATYTITSTKKNNNVGGALGNKTNISKYASGGYTGDWGDSSGKLAILHRKEMVLNKEDTSNFLDAVGIVRSIKDFIDMGARNLGNVFNYNVMAGAGTTDLQQQVHIEASFPNVQSHNEIELALNNLINSATQYVNRK